VVPAGLHEAARVLVAVKNVPESVSYFEETVCTAGVPAGIKRLL
jgi:hypothetical protein